jgi:hypothetical protein
MPQGLFTTKQAATYSNEPDLVEVNNNNTLRAYEKGIEDQRNRLGLLRTIAKLAPLGAAAGGVAGFLVPKKHGIKRFGVGAAAGAGLLGAYGAITNNRLLRNRETGQEHFKEKHAMHDVMQKYWMDKEAASFNPAGIKACKGRNKEAFHLKTALTAEEQHQAALAVHRHSLGKQYILNKLDERIGRGALIGAGTGLGLGGAAGALGLRAASKKSLPLTILGGLLGAGGGGLLGGRAGGYIAGRRTMQKLEPKVEYINRRFFHELPGKLTGRQ